jgi:hypothetical protein
MSTLPAKLTEHTPDQPDGLDPVCVAPPSRTCDDNESPPLRSGKRRMKVQLCSRCRHTLRVLAGHYDPGAALHLCARCDGEQAASANHHPRKSHRRQQCATVPSMHAMAQSIVARSATEGLASYGTTRGGPPSVRESALTVSGPAWTATADGYIDSFSPRDNGHGDTPAACFALGGVT